QYLSRTDNFSVLIHDPKTGATAAIDAPDEASIMKGLNETGWKLTDILVTHEHFDHIEGIPALKARFGCRVVAPRKSTGVPVVDQVVSEGDTVKVGSLVATVLDTPGHCADHIAYWFQQEKTVFAGDTLFAMGCGRIFDCTPQEFYHSMQKFVAMPDDTAVYCGHEYTLSNARFALTVDPTNVDLRIRALDIENKRAQNKVTLPTTIGLERATNPYFRTGDAAVQAALGMAGAAPDAVFAELRERKNRF
ncbi:MAG: hydroxyacylglutathione hydrolase, partial [Beijerinckiaceae bacterium]